MSRTNRLHTILLLILSLFILNGCGDSIFLSMKNMFSTKVWLKKVSFRANEDINDSSPVTLHILVPYKADLYADLLKLSSAEYFKKFEQIKRDNVDNLDVFTWDIIRSQRSDDEPVELSKTSGEGVIVFARYSTPGDHRMTVADDESIMIKLEKADFTIESIKK